MARSSVRLITMALGRSVSLHPDFSSLERSLDLTISHRRCLARSLNPSLHTSFRCLRQQTNHDADFAQAFRLESQVYTEQTSWELQSKRATERNPHRNGFKHKHKRGPLHFFQETFDNLGFLANAERIT